MRIEPKELGLSASGRVTIRGCGCVLAVLEDGAGSGGWGDAIALSEIALEDDLELKWDEVEFAMIAFRNG